MFVRAGPPQVGSYAAGNDWPNISEAISIGPISEVLPDALRCALPGCGDRVVGDAWRCDGNWTVCTTVGDVGRFVFGNAAVLAAVLPAVPLRVLLAGAAAASLRVATRAASMQIASP